MRLGQTVLLKTQGSPPVSGSGKVVQTGYESNISGAPMSIQKIEIQAKEGKLS